MTLKIFDPMLMIGISLAIVFLMPIWKALGGKKLAWWISIVLYAFNTLFMIGVAYRATLYPEGLIVKIGGFNPPFGIVLHVTLWGAILGVFVWFVAFLSMMYASTRFDAEPVDVYYALLTLIALGSSGMFLTGDIFNLFVFTEITALAAFGLSAFMKKRGTAYATIKYIIMAEVASTFLLVAIALLYGKLGTLNMLDAQHTLKSVSLTGAMVLSVLFFLVGYGVEAEIFPLNLWAPDVYKYVPEEVIALFISGSSKAAAFAWLRMWVMVFGVPTKLLQTMLWIGVLTFIFAETMAYSQKDFRRALGYASLGQAGLLFIAISLGSALSLKAALLLMINHILSEALLFYIAGNVGEDGAPRNMRIPMIFGFLGAVSMPPFIGFWGKIFLFMALAESGYWIMFTLIALFSIVEIAYMYRWFVSLYGGTNNMDLVRSFSPIMLTLVSFAMWFMPFVPKVMDFLDMAIKPFLQKGVM